MRANNNPLQRERPTLASIGISTEAQAVARIQRLEKRLAAAQDVVKVANELCSAIDLAEEDIGGARPIKDILGDLGPALNSYDAVVSPKEQKL